MSAPVFVVEAAALAAERVVVEGAEGRHAATVKRLRVGEEVVVTDGGGRAVLGVVAAVGKERIEVEVRERREEKAPEPRITVVQALPKGERGELAVEVMTEAGVDVIVPWAAARSITQWKAERREKSLGRWRNAAREAAKQSRRTHFPRITDLETTAQVAARLAAAPLALVLHEEAAEPLSGIDVAGAAEIVLVVGPEGGISPEELAAFAEAGAGHVLLGPTVLRTSTAGVAAASVLLAKTGRW
ncbi:16S rRNA (uracil(1498)-N(3))-methyltransferase [Actinocorallia sp. API 0066]|uniref:16S rRNA (uracil(1498)-N(3))-methyltransferase n=1 Tax=Actinocorallia sp. API 0066 TaxID=2896846 RepID=UPI001E33B68D|nr:16S rRNA (uracil(1498)-N(3))-methyltransferase [Actinocorallia sp. API 0066]MCD0453540.1 16S rRNA (uracil(1498)-N(3))-methyltransferase [Actinocorallia sp. API 0066]